MLRPHPSAPTYRADLDAIGDAVEAAARRREKEARKARGSLTRRVLAAARRNVMQVVPVVVIAALFCAGLVIRAQQVPVAGVVIAGMWCLAPTGGGGASARTGPRSRCCAPPSLWRTSWRRR